MIWLGAISMFVAGGCTVMSFVKWIDGHKWQDGALLAAVNLVCGILDLVMR